MIGLQLSAFMLAAALEFAGIDTGLWFWLALGIALPAMLHLVGQIVHNDPI